MIDTHASRRLRTGDAAEYVGLAGSTLEKMRVTGTGPRYIKAGPRAVVYDTDDLDEWLEARRLTSTSDRPDLRERRRWPSAPQERRRTRSRAADAG